MAVDLILSLFSFIVARQILIFGLNFTRIIWKLVLFFAKNESKFYLILSILSLINSGRTWYLLCYIYYCTIIFGVCCARSYHPTLYIYGFIFYYFVQVFLESVVVDLISYYRFWYLLC